MKQRNAREATRTTRSALRVALLAAVVGLGLQPAIGAVASAETEVAIRVDDLTIESGEFAAIFHSALRQKYYHGRVPAVELKHFKQRVAEDIVTQVVVHREARRLGLQPDQEAIARGIEAFDAKYASDPDWKAQRDRVMPQLALRLERQSLLEQMEARIRQVPRPDANAVKDFYRSYPEKFTEPEQVRGSVILLPVAPSASEESWSEIEAKASELWTQIDAGAEFADVARRYSAHSSATDGGDLGYLHRGMLDEKLQRQIDELAPGMVSDPIRVLEGVILFRVDDIRPPQLKQFAEVQERAAELLYRNLQDQAWDNFVSELKASADIYVNESLYVRSNYE